MARRPKGRRRRRAYSVAPDPRNGTQIVRFRHAGRQYKLSTGRRDLTTAEVRAAKLYSEVIGGRRAERAQALRPLDVLVSEWLASIEPMVSRGDFETCTDRWHRLLLPYFVEIESVTTPRVEDYMAERLTRVAAATVKKEVGVLRRS